MQPDFHHGLLRFLRVLRVLRSTAYFFTRSKGLRRRHAVRDRDRPPGRLTASAEATAVEKPDTTGARSSNVARYAILRNHYAVSRNAEPVRVRRGRAGRRVRRPGRGAPAPD